MNRRDFLTHSAGAVAAGAMLPANLSAALADGSGVAQKKRPNILLFVSDDHGAWALEGPRGPRELRAPELTRLASRGVTFANAFTPCPVCSPSRASLATGLTPSQHGILDYLGPAGAEATRRDWLGDLPTLFSLYHGAGYLTANIGKHHLGGALRGVDESFETTGGAAHFGKLLFADNGRPVELDGARAERVTDRAVAFIARAAAESRPFFAHVGYTQTHSPYLARTHDPAMVALHQDATFADLPAYRPHPWARNEGMPSDGPIAPEVVTEARRGYYAGVSEIDRALGRLRAALERLGVADNTIIIYTSDHGCAIGHNGIWGKGNSTRPLNMYDVSLRVPLIVHDPLGSRTARRVERAVTHHDTFQSLLEFGGLACPLGRTYPGRSWHPLLDRADAAWDDTVYGEYGDLRMIRTPQWKFVERYPRGPYDLYDLTNDPGEALNVAGADYTEKIQEELTKRLHDWYARHEDPGRSGLRVKELPSFNPREAWRDGVRERRGLQTG